MPTSDNSFENATKSNASFADDPVYQRIHTELLELNYRWNLYQNLFVSDKENIDLMNKVASGFFWAVQITLYHDIIIRIARLTDPEKQSKNIINASIERLASNYSTTKDFESESKIELKSRVASIMNLSKYLDTIRHKKIAHIDFFYATESAKKSKLNNQIIGSHSTIKCLIGALTEMMNFINDSIDIPPVVYSEVIADGGGAVELIRALRRSLEYRNLEIAGKVQRIN